MGDEMDEQQLRDLFLERLSDASFNHVKRPGLVENVGISLSADNESVD
jgi:hypothetical protein